MSDGAPAISAGSGASFPSCDYLHIECWSHLHPLTVKNLLNNSNTLSFSIPDSAIGNIADGHQRNIINSKMKKKVIDFIVYNLNLARNTISSALAGIPSSQSSIESVNHRTKVELGDHLRHAD